MFVEQNVKNKTAVALITSAVVTAPAAASASAVVDQAVKEISFFAAAVDVVAVAIE